MGNMKLPDEIVFTTLKLKAKKLLVANTGKLQKIKLDVRPMSQQNLWSCHRVLTASYRVEHSSSMESRSSSAGSSAFIESSAQNWSSRLSTTDDRRGLETFCLKTTRIHSNTYTVHMVQYMIFFLLFFSWIISMTLCLVLFLRTLLNIYNAYLWWDQG